MRVAILQGMIPHYRESFFNKLSEEKDIDLYTYEKENELINNNMKTSNINSNNIKSRKIFNRFLLYNFLHFLKPKYNIIILPGEIKSISTWILLLILKFTNKKVILWGHGISIPRYIKEEKSLLFIRLLFHKFADKIWLYTKEEKKIWDKYINPKKVISLDNTIDTSHILKRAKKEKNHLKNKYNIKTKLNFIYCARFNENRRIDLMISLINKMDSKRYGFIIIGEGPSKPNFSKFENVYDFGSVYDTNLKNDLFDIADLYFQPAWLGLSVVEAMAYGKPILTFKRTIKIYQCVEYSYVKNNYNGFKANTVEELISYIINLKPYQINNLSKNSINMIKKELSLNSMVHNAIESLKND